MTNEEMLDRMDYSLSILKNEIGIYKVALWKCDFETAKIEVRHIEEKCIYFEINARAYRDKVEHND